MGRRSRSDPEGGIHHVMNRGVDRGDVFFADADRVEFGRRLADIHDRFGAQTLAYCLMGNHYHLLVRTPDGGLSDAMHHLGSVYTRHVNDRVGRDGPLFRGRFHSIPVTSDGYLLWVARYIHRNPLDLPGVSDPTRYRWSSLRTYLGHRRVPSFMHLDVVLGLFDGDRQQFATFTADAPPIPRFGDDDVASLIRFSILHDDVIHGADHASAHQGVERTLGVLLTDPKSVPHPRPVGDEGADAARRMALSRARRRLATDPALRRMLDTVVSQSPAAWT